MQTPEEMTMLAIKAKNDPNALLHLWQGCSRYAYKVTMIYQQAAALNGAVDMDDLRQCAFLGFYEAVQGFDHLRGDFSSPYCPTASEGHAGRPWGCAEDNARNTMPPSAWKRRSARI